MKIAVLKDDLTGNAAADDADNQAEADFVSETLSKNHDVAVFPFTSDLEKNKRTILNFAPDVVFNLVESVANEDSLAVTATLLLETLNIPFTGNPTAAHLISADKALAKKVLTNAGIATPTAEFQAGKTYLLKAKTQHASVGLDDSCVVTPASRKALNEAIAAKEAETNAAWIAEEFIDGREFNVAVLGEDVLPPAEIVFASDFRGHKILTYEAKWDENCPAYQQSLRSFDMDAQTAKDIKSVTLRCARVCGLKGYARIDFRQDKNGTLYAIDINTNPCIVPDSGFVAMAHRFGLTDEDLMKRIVKNAFV